MSPNFRLASSALALVLAHGSTLAQDVEPARTRRPNVVLLVADDMRHDSVGFAGDELAITPHLDALAAEGVRFENAFATTAICATSRASILSGQWARRHGVWDFRTALPDESWAGSLPVQLAECGWRTGFVGKWGVGGATPREDYAFWAGFGGQGQYFVDGPDGERLHMSSRIEADALRFLDECSADEPFFLHVAFKAPHVQDGAERPFQPDPRHEAQHAGVDVPAPATASEAHFAALPEFLQTSEGRVRWRTRFDGEELRAASTRDYYALVTGVDRVLGSVRAKLAERGLAEDTIVVFTSDHGFFLGEHGLAGKWTPHEESIRIPLVWHDPGLSAARVGASVADDALLVDLAPSLLARCGIAPSRSMQGRDLGPALDGLPRSPRSAWFYEHLFPHARIPKVEALRRHDWKLMRWLLPEGEVEQLFHIAEDPREEHDLAGAPEHLDLQRAMGAELEARRARAARVDAPPNLVLIISDDQAWSDFGFQGSRDISTPHLDRLAAEGLVFPRAYNPTSLCAPSLASLVTGLAPRAHGITGNEPPHRARAGLRNDADYRATHERWIARTDQHASLPRLLAPAGYLGLQTGKWWLGSAARGGFSHGMTHGDPTRGGRHGDLGLSIGREGFGPVEAFLDAAEVEPFFLWYAPFLPHRPHDPPQALLERHLSSAPSAHVARYRAMCEWFDQSVGELIALLEERGALDNTLIAFVTDNGWVQSEGSAGYAPRSKRSPHEGGLRTPIVLWGAGVEPGRYERPVSTLDLFPTLLGAAGLEAPADRVGVDLFDRAALDAREHVSGAVYLHTERVEGDLLANLRYEWVVSDGWKLIQPGPAAAESSRVELYHLDLDPHETRELAAAEPERVDALMSIFSPHD